VSQGLCPFFSGTLHPLAYGPFSYPQGLGYLRLFQPRSFNSKARKRLPSRQLVACWLDSVFSIVG
jgi:hypothetical protein